MAAGNQALSDTAAPFPDRLKSPTGPPCTICHHRDRDAIDTELSAPGHNMLAIARKFAVSDDAVYRHREKHLPARLLRNGEALAAAADKEFVKLAITSSAARLADLQEALDGLKVIKARRAAKAHEDAPGSETGLLTVRRRAIRTPDGEGYEHVIDSEVDTALLAEMRALHLAAARETGEWLAQTGRGSFGSGAGVNGPLVIVLSSGLQPLPGDGPGVARHRITDPRRRVTATAAAAGVPLGMGDIDQAPEWIAEDTREPSLSGMVDDLESDDGPASSLEDDAGDAAG